MSGKETQPVDPTASILALLRQDEDYEARLRMMAGITGAYRDASIEASAEARVNEAQEQLPQWLQDAFDRQADGQATISKEGLTSERYEAAWAAMMAQQTEKTTATPSLTRESFDVAIEEAKRRSRKPFRVRTLPEMRPRDWIIYQGRLDCWPDDIDAEGERPSLPSALDLRRFVLPPDEETP